MVATTAAASSSRQAVDLPIMSMSPPAPLQPRHARLHPDADDPSFTFVCLGVGGGPLENDCSCYLLKPAHRSWTDGSVVVEGGSWLGALTRVLEDVGPGTAFHDTEFPFETPALRAGFIGSFAHSFLISHAHLDHILGMVLGSASLPGKRNVYGLKGTLDNLLDVFNGKIWPKLASYSDEGGPGVYRLKPLESLQRLSIDDDLSVLPFALSHGLNPSVLPAPPTPTPAYASRLSLSGKRLSLPLNGYFSTPATAIYPPERSGTLSSAGEKPIFTSPFAPEGAITTQVASIRLNVTNPTSDLPPDSDSLPQEPTSPTTMVAAPMSASSTRSPASNLRGAVPPPSSAFKLQAARARRPKTALGSEKANLPQASGAPMLPPAHVVDHNSRASSIAAGANLSGRRQMAPTHVNIEPSFPALDSTAFFITNERTGKDVLFFGDVEPDTVSESPRNGRIWAHAGERFADGKLNTVFLECSFPASHPTEFLYGHLSVAHVFDELRVLARSVVAERKRSSARKERNTATTSFNSRNAGSEGAFRRLMASQLPPIPALHTSEKSITEEELHNSLAGLHVVIIHIKTALFPSYEATPRPSNSSVSSYGTAENGSEAGGHTNGSTTHESSDAEKTAKAMPFVGRKIDPRSMQVRILQELNEIEEQAKLGVHFVIAAQGMRIEC